MRWPGSQRCEEAAPAGRRKPAVKTDGGGASARYPGAESDHRKKLVRPKAKRTAAIWMVARFGLSPRRVCRLLTLDRNTFRYQSRRSDDSGLRTRMREIAESKRRYGCPRIIRAAATGRLDSESQEGRANLSRGRARIAASGAEESHGGTPRRIAAAQPARALLCDGFRP